MLNLDLVTLGVSIQVRLKINLVYVITEGTIHIGCLAANRKEAAGFLSRYLCGPLPYV